MMALYLPRKVITFKSFMDSLSEGFKLMVPAVTILVFAWTLKGVGDAMGLAQFVGSVVGDHASASIFIPVVLFAVAVFLFDGNLLGNVRDSCADCNGHVRRRNKSGDDDYLGIRRPGRGGLR